MLQKKPQNSPWRHVAALLIWLMVWQASYWLVGQDLLLSSPGQVFWRLAVLMAQGDFWLSTFWSLVRIEAGFILGVLAGTVLGVATAKIGWLDAIFRPAISAIRATPVASFIILALVWMSSNRVVVFIVFLMVLPIVWANVAEGIRKTDPQLLEMASVFRMRKGQILRLIYLPSVSPFFVAAASTSLGLGWKAGIAAEVLSTPRYSLGGELYNAKIYLETADLLAFTLLIIILSLLLEKILLRVLRRTETYFRRHGRLEETNGLTRREENSDGEQVSTTRQTDQKQGGNRT
jgi:NitT/TauT family transport system permease protein